MRLIDLLRGIVTGYGVRGIQIVVGLAMVPFLIRDDVLGVERYGHAFVILSSLAAASILTDGIKLACSRLIARSVQDRERAPGLYVGVGLRVLLGVAIPFAVLVLVFRDGFMSATGLPGGDDYELAIIFAVIRLVVSEGLAVYRMLLLAHGRLDYLNGFQAIEVVGRNSYYVIAFSLGDASVAAFVGAQTVGAAFKELSAFGYAMVRYRDDLSGVMGARFSDAWRVLKDSFSIGLTTLFYMILYRLSIPFVNRTVGSESAGLLALVINTADTNLRQALLTVVQPMLVPIASRLELDRLSPHRRGLLLDFEATFGAAVLMVTVPVAAVMPVLLELWLGPGLVVLTTSMQCMLVGVAVQIAFTVRRSLLLGQGMALQLAVRSAPLAVLTIGLGAAAVIMTGSWLVVAAAIATYSIATNAFAVGALFESRLMAPEASDRRGSLRFIGAASLGFGLAVWLSQGASVGRIGYAGSAGIVAALGALAAIHFVLIPMPRVVGVLRTIRRSPQRQLFTDR